MTARVRACINVDKTGLANVIKLETRRKALVISRTRALSRGRLMTRNVQREDSFRRSSDCVRAADRIWSRFKKISLLSFPDRALHEIPMSSLNNLHHLYLISL